MINWLKSFLKLEIYLTPQQRERAVMMYAAAIFSLIAYSIFILFFPTSFVTSFSHLGFISAEAAAGFYAVFYFMLGIASIVLARRGQLEYGNYAVLLMLALGVGGIGVLGGFSSPSTLIPLMILIVLGGLLNRTSGLLVGGGLAIVIYLLGVLVGIRPAGSPPVTLTEVASVLFNTLAVMGVTYMFVRLSRYASFQTIAQATQDRLQLAEIMTDIAHNVSSRTALSDVLANAVNQIVDAYPRIYHAQIFLLDTTGAKAELVASTGEVGKLLLERKHNLEVGSASVIGRVTSSGEPIIARAGSDESVHRRNEFLPDTVVEAALPMRIGNTIIGALDMQSKQTDVFHEIDLPIFQALADNIAVAIDSARLFEETERQLANNQQLVEQTQQAVQEVERLNRQLTGRAWERYLQGRSDSLSLTADFGERTTVFPVAETTPTLLDAMRRDEVVHTEGKEARVVAVPLRVRGQVIGAMEFEVGADDWLTPEDLQLVQVVGERFGVAIENSRLFEESQRIAYREAMVNEIATRLQASNRIESVLAEAARSLQETLNVGKVAIRLGSPPSEAQMQGNGAS